MGLHKGQSNKGTFQKGHVPVNKGKSLEELIGNDRAKLVKNNMSINSYDKGKFLTELNHNPEVLKKRKESRLLHDNEVAKFVNDYRNKGTKVFWRDTHDKQPDAIIIEDNKIIAIEIESIRNYKASREVIEERYRKAHLKNGFFDKVKVIWF